MTWEERFKIKKVHVCRKYNERITIKHWLYRYLTEGCGWRGGGGLMSQFMRKRHCFHLRKCFKEEKPTRYQESKARENFHRGNCQKNLFHSNLQCQIIIKRQKKNVLSFIPNKACSLWVCSGARIHVDVFLLLLQRINFLCRGKGKNRWKSTAKVYK